MYIIETSNGFVLTFKTIGSEINEVTSYTQDRSLARQFTTKQIKSLQVRSFFRYHSMAIIIHTV